MGAGMVNRDRGGQDSCRKNRKLVIFSSLVLLCFAGGPVRSQEFAASPDYRNAALSFEKRVDDLVQRMTLSEKVSQMQNQSVAIPRLGIPAYNWWNEGLHGLARSGYATVFPQAIGLAATWDTELLQAVAETISTEARAKYNHAIAENNRSIYFGLTFWSPNINIFRDPRWGRGQETYGEDPYLSSRLGVAFVSGMQGKDPKHLRVVATPKHFAVHSGPESVRHRFNATPSPFDLEDTYLPAFRATVTEGQADSVMCAYNAIDGVPACADRELLGNVLRGNWKFQGYVTSDCGAVHDFFAEKGHKFSADVSHAAAAGVLAGTDTSCGNEYAALSVAVKAGVIQEAAIDTAVKRLFMARFRLGMFDSPANVPFSKIAYAENDSPAHRALALEAARRSIVLLKDDNASLPLRSTARKIAVIGPNAASLAALEGNYNGEPSRPVLPIDGIEQEFSRAQVTYAQGAPYVDGLPLPVPRSALRVNASLIEPGLKAEYYSNSTLNGKPVLTRVDKQIDFDWNAASPAAGVPANDFGVRWTGTIAVPRAGDYGYVFSFAHCYPCFDRESYSAYFDGREVAKFSTSDKNSSRSESSPSFSLHFADTKPHALRIDYTHHSALFGAGLTWSWQPPKGSLLQEAIRAAKESDVTVAFVGLSPDLEGEEMPIHVAGFADGDRTNIDLPASQQELLRAVAETGKPLIIVLMNGSALAVNWAQEHANAILEAWYGGEAGGQAIAETLSGKNNPAGRLPVTFYKSLDQLPAFTDYSMRNRTYRFFHGDPLYRFGYGLSYTRFAYSNIRLSSGTLRAGAPLVVDVTVRNAGDVQGDEVAQVYLAPALTSAPLPPEGSIRALRGFQRLSLAPGESRRVRFQLDARRLSQVSESGSRAMRAGEYTVSVGGGQPVAGSGDVSAGFTITGETSLAK